MKLAMIHIFLLSLGSAGAQSVGIGTNAPVQSAMLDVTSNTRGFLPPRMDSNARNAIMLPASGLTIYNTSIKAFECFNGTNWYSTVHYIGERYGGGIVFYVYDNGQHGLVAADADQGSLIQWDNDSLKLTGCTGDGLNAGSMNTAMIVAAQIPDNQSGNFAARVCADYSVTVGGIRYGDWYLPSKHELNLLYNQKNVVGSFSSYYYWSSTENSFDLGWVQNFSDGVQDSGNKFDIYYVRAIRAF